MKSKFRTVPPHDERIYVVLPANLKRQLFEAAASEGVPASQLIRKAIVQIADHLAA